MVSELPLNSFQNIATNARGSVSGFVDVKPRAHCTYSLWMTSNRQILTPSPVKAAEWHVKLTSAVMWSFLFSCVEVSLKLGTLEKKTPKNKKSERYL